MKKLIVFLMTILFAGSILAACGNDNNEEDNQGTDNGQTENPVNDTDEPTNEDEDTEGTEDPDETEEPDESTDSSGNGGIFEGTEEDQLGLSIGDTGTFEATIGTYEVTLESAEIVGEELDGVSSLLDELIVLELTFKNIGDNVLQAEEVMDSMEITEDLEKSGYSNGAPEFDSIEVFEGEIQPGEERSAQFIGDILSSDEYHFRKSQGNVEAGTSNQVTWTISDDEARNE